MDLWLLELDYEKLISQVEAKMKKSDGVEKKIYLKHIIKEPELRIVASMASMLEEPSQQV